MIGATHEDSEDSEAIRQCQQGDMAGLGLLVAHYQVAGLRLAYLLTGDHDLANDIVQDSFLLAYRGIKRFRLGEPFGPWFFRIVTNAARQQQRQARRRREVSLDAPAPAGPDDLQPRSYADTLTATRADPVARAEAMEARAALLNVLATLPQKQREAVVLRYYMDYADPQIARVLGCRLGAVQQRLHAGRLNLQQAIRRQYPWLLGALSTLPATES